MELNISQIVVGVIVVVISGVLHEYMHGFVAYKMGDPTAYLEGRLTLNPIAHLSLVESIILPLITYISFGKFFGGAKPVPINPYYFKNPSKGLMIASAVGPLTNIVIGIVFAFLFGLFQHKLQPNTLDTYILINISLINLILGFFNFIPIPPLDGSRVLRHFLPQQAKEILDRIEVFGFFILIILMLSGVFMVLFIPVVIVFDFFKNFGIQASEFLFTHNRVI